MTIIGVQTMMLRDEITRTGPFETMRKVSEIGYHLAEISAVPMTTSNVREFVRAREELGLRTAAISAALTLPASGAPGESLETHFEKIVADAAVLQTSLIRMGMIPMAALESLESVLDFCERSNHMATRLSDHGIELVYHNHHIEFAKYGGRYLLDVIAEEAPRMGLEVDVHWVHRGGGDPATTIKKYGERVRMVHLKDYRIGQIPPEAFKALADGDEGPIAAALAQSVQFAEVGEGSLDFPAIIEASLAVNAPYLLVEQDEHYGRAPLDCLRTSHENLVALGYGELFELNNRTNR